MIDILMIRILSYQSKDLVSVNSRLSTWAEVLSGIPQDRVLGPRHGVNSIPELELMVSSGIGIDY